MILHISSLHKHAFTAEYIPLELTFCVQLHAKKTLFLYLYGVNCAKVLRVIDAPEYFETHWLLPLCGEQDKPISEDWLEIISTNFDSHSHMTLFKITYDMQYFRQNWHGVSHHFSLSLQPYARNQRRSLFLKFGRVPFPPIPSHNCLSLLPSSSPSPVQNSGCQLTLFFLMYFKFGNCGW